MRFLNANTINCGVLAILSITDQIHMKWSSGCGKTRQWSFVETMITRRDSMPILVVRRHIRNSRKKLFGLHCNCAPTKILTISKIYLFIGSCPLDRHGSIWFTLRRPILYSATVPKVLRVGLSRWPVLIPICWWSGIRTRRSSTERGERPYSTPAVWVSRRLAGQEHATRCGRTGKRSSRNMNTPSRRRFAGFALCRFHERTRKL